MNYVEVTLILVSEEDYLLDLFIQSLADAGFESFQEIELGIKAYAPSSLFSMKEAEKKVKELFEIWITNNQLSFEINLIPSRNWNREWESNFKPVIIGKDLLIKAPFHELEGEFKYELIIEPKMAFGTGHHETTCLMAQFLLEQEIQGKKILDMGCGTGILGILADKMGAESVMAVDIDEVCYQSALENGISNLVHSMQVMKGDIDRVMEEHANRPVFYDIIVANINRNVLIRHIPYYSELLAHGGNLFLSGFYEKSDLEIITEQARKSDLKYLFHKTLQGWCATQFYK